MNGPSAVPTPTGLLSAAVGVLTDSGYRLVTGKSSDWETASSRLFEDAYSVVGVAVFATCRELLRRWPELQESLVDVISRHVMATEGKAWDGYLALLTPAVAPSERAAIEAIRYDTARLRKLVATGDDLTVETDVERILRPLLPMTAGDGEVGDDAALLLLPTLLADHGIDESVSRSLIEAFTRHTPLMEALHETRRSL